MKDLEKLQSRLQEFGIRPSYQRIKILEHFYLYEGHPTVDDIYLLLVKKIPTLSKTTIYNTLKRFAEAGLVRSLNIDETEMHFDMILDPHGHFKCMKCKKISNFKINVESLSISGLGGFIINQKDVFFRGICPDCISHE